MKISKTSFASYSLNGISEGCKLCIQGKKLVLFVTGKCSTNCFYCPLSNLRKNASDIWANERKCKNIKEILEEARQSNACGAGITGGDPLLDIKKTIAYAKALKGEFKDFHIHIYLSTKLVNDTKLKSLSKYIDEVRFHPESLTDAKKQSKDIEKISLAKKYFKKENIGIEIPIFPDKEKETINFLKNVLPYVGFVNLNELEIGDSNSEYIIKNYSLDKSGYTIKNSIKTGLNIIKYFADKKIKVHLCTAETKNWHQYKNRLLQRKILSFGKRTKDGTVIYFSIFKDKNIYFEQLKSCINPEKSYYDSSKERIILDKNLIEKYLNDFVITRTEEFPTHDGLESVSEDIN